MIAKKRTLLFVAGLLALVVIMLPGMAFANNGVHGGYTMNTDQCAGCHRAHTAPSAVTWRTTTTNEERSALLLGTATELYAFCLTCHGASAMGADTNVEEGLYEARASGGAYGTPGDPLISGPFGVYGGVDPVTNKAYNIDGDGNRITSTHDYFGGTWGAFGGGVYGLTATQSINATYTASLVPTVGVGSQQLKMDCGSCHDVHGSSNYRLLKATVAGVVVGGYDGAGNPTPFVESNEPGYPAGGFALHTSYMGSYQANYTEAFYRRPTNAAKGMSGWCVGCHTFYMGVRGEKSIANTYTADTFFGTVVRHRHPVNVPLDNFDGPIDVVADQSTLGAGNPQLPLGHAAGENVPGSDDWIDCMTCHYAHGSSAVMTGYANVADPTDQIENSGSGGVAPTDDSALLRFDNRYVCQACHNK